jgi:paraquat-inducible protein A
MTLAETAGRLRECPDCGLIQHVPPLPRGAMAQCSRCQAVLRRQRTDPQGRALALAITGLLLFAMASQTPFMHMELDGRQRQTMLFTGPGELEQHGLWMLSVVVLATTIAAPLAKLLAIAWVMIGLRLARPPQHLFLVFRWVERLGTWSMIEVFLLGLFVAYNKLADLAQVQIGLAAYMLGALMLVMAAADATLDRDDVWEALQRAGATAAPVLPPAPAQALVGCDCCGLVTAPARCCPRCGAVLRHRKLDSLSRSWALLVAAAVLYIPANLLPVMTLSTLSYAGGAQTILSGVRALAREGMWPLAALVFFASITVPVLKLVGLSFLLLSIRAARRGHLQQRTVLFRIVDSVGRWSMIDVFMISILTGLVQMGALATVTPGPGVVAFCAVVILTILSALTFDPRLMWDAAAPVPRLP